jgi:hypothetical protein
LEPLFTPGFDDTDEVDLFPRLLNNALNFLFDVFIISEGFPDKVSNGGSTGTGILVSRNLTAFQTPVTDHRCPV